MTRIRPRHSRRTLLKGLAVTLPVAWSRPVVEAVVLPAHAQTSPMSCSAEEGCYTLTTPGQSFIWPGGTGPTVVNFFGSVDCSGNPIGTLRLVVAANAATAAALLSCLPNAPVIEPPTDPALSGCGFFFCGFPPT